MPFGRETDRAFCTAWGIHGNKPVGT